MERPILPNEIRLIDSDIDAMNATPQLRRWRFSIP
jgi:hypothetical protein